MRKKQHNREIKREIAALKKQDADLNLQLLSVKNDYDEMAKKNAEVLNDYANNLKRVQKIEASIQECNEGILK